MVLAFLLGFFLVALISLLLTPLNFYIDTDTNQYYIQLKGVAKASVLTHPSEVLRIRLEVFF